MVSKTPKKPSCSYLYYYECVLSQSYKRDRTLSHFDNIFPKSEQEKKIKNKRKPFSDVKETSFLKISTSVKKNFFSFLVLLTFPQTSSYW